MDNIATNVNESKINVGLDQKDRKQLAEGLSRALAETYVLYLKTQGLHWNVVGPFFFGLHKMTEEQYENLAAAVDELAERIRAVGFPTPASFQAFSQLAETQEWQELPKAEDAVRTLVADHERVARSFRQIVDMATDIDDVVTADMLTGRMQHHETMAWMLRSVIGN